MSNDNEFDDLFQESQPEPLTEARVRQIASDQHFRDLAAMQQAGAAVSQRRAAALERAEARHPGFGRLYHEPTVTDRFKAERPRTAGWIGLAEVQGTDEDVDEFYDSFYNEVSQYEINETNSQPQQGRALKQPPGGPFSLTEINRLPLGEKRREAIEALKNRVGDTPLDEADPENARFKRERGEE